MPLVGLAFTKTALDNLEDVPHKIRAQIIKKAKALILAPHSASSKQMKGMRSDDGEIIYRERSGDYRILYVVREVEVVVLDIDHRKNIYR